MRHRFNWLSIGTALFEWFFNVFSTFNVVNIFCVCIYTKVSVYRSYVHKLFHIFFTLRLHSMCFDTIILLTSDNSYHVYCLSCFTGFPRLFLAFCVHFSVIHGVFTIFSSSGLHKIYSNLSLRLLVLYASFLVIMLKSLQNKNVSIDGNKMLLIENAK